MTAQIMERHAASEIIEARARSVCTADADKTSVMRMTSVRTSSGAGRNLETLATSAAAQLQALAASEGVHVYAVDATASHHNGSNDSQATLDLFIESPEPEAVVGRLVDLWHRQYGATHAGAITVSVRVIDWYAVCRG